MGERTVQLSLRYSAGTSKESNICDSFLTEFYNRVFGEYFQGSLDEKVGMITGSWHDSFQKIMQYVKFIWG